MKHIIIFLLLVLSFQAQAQQTSALGTPDNDSKWYWPFTFNGQRFYIGPTAANTLLWNDGFGIFWIDTTDVDNQIANEVPVTDAGGHFTATDVEGVLQEIGAWDAGNIDIVDLAGNYETTAVEGALQEIGNKPYGEAYIIDTNPDTLSFLAGSTTPQKIEDTTQGLISTNDITYSDGRITYTGTRTIVLPVKIHLSYDFGENATDVNGWVYKNGSTLGKGEFHRTIGSANSKGSSAIEVFVSMATNDYIETFVAPSTHSGDDDIIVYSYGLLVGTPQF